MVLAGMGQLPLGVASSSTAAVTGSLLGRLEAPLEMPASVLDQTHDACRSVREPAFNCLFRAQGSRVLYQTSISTVSR